MYSVVTAFWFITASRFRSGSTSSSSGMAPNNNRGAVGLEIDDAFSVGCVPCLLPPPPPAPLPQSSTTAERLLSPASSLLVFSACSNRMSWFLRALCRDYGVRETIYFRVGCSRQAPRCSFSGTACLIPITQGARIITCRAVVHEALCETPYGSRYGARQPLSRLSGYYGHGCCSFQYTGQLILTRLFGARHMPTQHGVRSRGISPKLSLAPESYGVPLSRRDRQPASCGCSAGKGEYVLAAN